MQTVESPRGNGRVPKGQRKEEKDMKKMFALLLVLVLALTCLSACGASSDSDLKYIQKKGTMIVGITDYEPMDYKDENGNWTGFDAELAEQVCEKLGVKCEFLVLGDWGKKFYELDTKNIDAIWNGMTITDEVKLNASVSNPYVKNAQVVVMNKLSAPDYDAIELLRTLTFAVEAGSAGEAELKAMDITDYTAVQSQSSALMEVAAGTANACVIDITKANAMTGEGTGYPDLAIASELSSEEYGIGFRKDSDVTAKVNELLQAMKADGSLQALADKYSLTLAD